MSLRALLENPEDQVKPELTLMENGGNATVVLKEGEDGGEEALIRRAGLDPNEFAIDYSKGVRTKNWEALRRVYDPETEKYSTIKEPMKGISFTVVKRPVTVDTEDLERLIASAPTVPPATDRKPSTLLLALGDLQLGKALASDTPILTANRGWVEHGELVVGDEVFAPSGKPVKVTYVHPSRVSEAYRVELSDGSSVVADGNHDWMIERKMHPRGYKRDSSLPKWEPRGSVATTLEIAKMLKQESIVTRPVMLPEHSPLEYGDGLPDGHIEPHLLGLWLGDGNQNDGSISGNIHSSDVLERHGSPIVSMCKGDTYVVYVKGLLPKLKKQGLYKNKHIPEEYISDTTVQERLELLQGLMDSDGYISPDGACFFTNTNKRLVDDTRRLLLSLGIRCTERSGIGKIYGVEHKPYYELTFRTKLPVVTSRFKSDRLRESTERQGMRRVIRSIESVGERVVQCISVEGGEYLAGHGLMPTHNCENPLAGVIARFNEGLDRAVKEAEDAGVDSIVIAWMGDCIEGFVSQGGRNAWRTVLTLTEQLRIIRRLMLRAIDRFIDEGYTNITAISVPGNHGDTIREPVTTRYDDSYDTDSLVAVWEALQVNPERYGDKVTIVVPEADEIGVALSIEGVSVAFIHGHQFRPKKHWEWWEGQSLGRTPYGNADVLFTGHGHHTIIEERSERTFVMAPSLEERSTWWVHKTGQVGNPGVILARFEDGEMVDVHKVTTRSGMGGVNGGK